MYRTRRRRLLLGVVLILLLAYTVGQSLDDTGHGSAPASRPRSDRLRTYAPAVRCPQQGQAALGLGNGRPLASPYERPTPIASLAKVMTAYLTLERYPLSGTQDGFKITVSAAESQAVAQDRAEGQSVVAVQAGEQLTERQLLEALLIPSGNNIGRILAALVAGSETGFLAEMNAEARAFGMGQTTYTDPSGFDPGTVSTAADQLRVFERAMRFPTFRQIVSMPSVALPVAGTLTNYNPLLAQATTARPVRTPRLEAAWRFHSGDGRWAPTDRCRRGAGAGTGQRRAGASGRRRAGRAADRFSRHRRRAHQR